MVSKKWDIFPKIQEEYAKSTKLGAMISILGLVMVLCLIVFEVRDYVKVDYDHKMVLDMGINDDSVKMDFQFELLNINCDKIEFSNEITKGTVHIFSPEQILKQPSKTGCVVSGVILTDKVGGYLKFKVLTDKKDIMPNKRAPPQSPQDIFGARLTDSIVSPDLSHTIKYFKFLPSSSKIGKLDTKKIEYDPDGDGVNDNLSEHTSSLNGVAKRFTVSNNGSDIGLYNYNLQVVPLHFYSISGKEKHLNQYAVTEKFVNVATVTSVGATVAGTYMKDCGIVFSYDFYPVKLVMEEKRGGFIEFLANLFGIVGGTITIVGMFDALVYRITKAKHD